MATALGATGWTQIVQTTEYDTKSTHICTTQELEIRLAETV